jgi:glucokinase
MTSTAAQTARVVGVDVGGTKISAAAMQDGRLSALVVEPTELSSATALIDQIERVVRAQAPYEAVTVAVPAVVDQATGSVRFGVNVPLAGLALRALLSERLDVPVVLENDATAAAMAEAYDEQLGLVGSVVLVVTVGTGVGCGVVIDGRPYRGATGAAAEVGHMVVGANLAKGAPVAASVFPHSDSLEALASGRALDRLAQKRGLSGGPALVEAACAGELNALEVLRLVGERLGVGVANLVNLFDPDLIAIGGGVADAGDLILHPVRDVARRFTLPGVGTRTRVELAYHGVHAGVRGAALLALEALEPSRATRGRDSAAA